MYTLNPRKSYLKDLDVLDNKSYDKLIIRLKPIFQMMKDEMFFELAQVPYRAHKLKGNYIGHWDIHVQNDIVLIYIIDENNKTIDLVRIGSHARIFK